MELKDTKAYKQGRYSFLLYHSIWSFKEEELGKKIQDIQLILKMLSPIIIKITDTNNYFISELPLPVRFNLLSKEEQRLFNLNFQAGMAKTFYQELCLSMALFSESTIKLKKEILYIAWQVFPRLYKATHKIPTEHLKEDIIDVPQPTKIFKLPIKKKTIELIELWNNLFLQIIFLQFFGIRFDDKLQIIYPKETEIFPIAIQHSQDKRLTRFLFSIPGKLTSTDIKPLIAKLYTELRNNYYATISDTIAVSKKGKRLILSTKLAGISRKHWGSRGLKCKREESVSQRDQRWKTQAKELYAQGNSLNKIANILQGECRDAKITIRWSTIRRKLSVWKISSN